MKRTLQLTAVLVLACLAVTPVFANHTWGNYHWARTSNPMALQVVDSVTTDWQFELNTSLNEWNQSNALNMSITSADDSKRARRQCKAVSGKIRVCNNTYGNNGWLGLASINIDSNGHITQGTAKMNDTYSSYWTDPNEKRHVMCQEVGHLFGLGHTSEDGSSQGTCMDYSNSPNSISPNNHDYQLLSDIYSHVDSYNSYATSSATIANDRVVPAGVASAAVLVHAGPFSEIWVQGHPDGGITVYHVRLVKPEGDGHDH